MLILADVEDVEGEGLRAELKAGLRQELSPKSSWATVTDRVQTEKDIVSTKSRWPIGQLIHPATRRALFQEKADPKSSSWDGRATPTLTSPSQSVGPVFTPRRSCHRFVQPGVAPV